MKRLALFVAIAIVSLYVAWRNEMLRWPPFGPRATVASDDMGPPGAPPRPGRGPAAGPR